MGVKSRISLRWLLCCAFAVGCAHGDRAADFPGDGVCRSTQPALSPLETMHLFRARLVSGDEAGAKALLAKGVVDRSGKEDADGAFRHARGWAGGQSDFAILEAKEEADVAIVIVNKFLKGGRETVDIDPIPLLRQDGTWKVVPHILALGQDRLREISSLGEWYRKRKEELKKELLK